MFSGCPAVEQVRKVGKEGPFWQKEGQIYHRTFSGQKYEMFGGLVKSETKVGFFMAKKLEKVGCSAHQVVLIDLKCRETHA